MLGLQLTKFVRSVTIYCDRLRFDPINVNVPRDGGKTVCEVESANYKLAMLEMQKCKMRAELTDLNNGNVLKIIYKLF